MDLLEWLSPNLKVDTAIDADMYNMFIGNDLNDVNWNDFCNLDNMSNIPHVSQDERQTFETTHALQDSSSRTDHSSLGIESGYYIPISPTSSQNSSISSTSSPSVPTLPLTPASLYPPQFPMAISAPNTTHPSNSNSKGRPRTSYTPSRDTTTNRIQRRRTQNRNSQRIYRQRRTEERLKFEERALLAEETARSMESRVEELMGIVGVLEGRLKREKGSEGEEVVGCEDDGTS